MKFLTERQLQILEALGTYQYLTASQLQRVLGVQTASYVNKLLRSLGQHRPQLIGSRDFGFHPGSRRLPKVYFLSLRGARFLRDELMYPSEDLKYPRGQNTIFSRDLFHRLAVIDFHIQFREWALNSGHSGIRFRSDFERHSHSALCRTFETSCGMVIPDGVGMIGTGTQKRAFLFERHNGDQTLRAFQQIQRHVRLLAEGGASDALGCPGAVGVFFSFENGGCMKNTLLRLSRWHEFRAFERHFWFRYSGEAFLEGWVQAEKKEAMKASI